MCGSRSPQIRRSPGVRPLVDRCGRGALRSGRSLRPRAHLPCGPRRSERSTATRRVRARARPRARCATPRDEAAAGLAGAGAASSPRCARADDAACSCSGARRPPRAAAAAACGSRPRGSLGTPKAGVRPLRVRPLRGRSVSRRLTCRRTDASRPREAWPSRTEATSADRQGARGLCPRAFPAKRRTPSLPRSRE
jgi:hypothetical protein